MKKVGVEEDGYQVKPWTRDGKEFFGNTLGQRREW